MEAFARAPEPLTKTDDMASNWHSWKEDFIIFMKVTGYIDKPNDIRANLLKNRIGKVGIAAIQAISFDNPDDKDDMDVLIAKLEEFFNPPKNEVVERYQFFTRDKKQSETIEEYINILKEKAKTCNFNDLTDSIIRDKIILGTQDKILRKKYFETKKLDLQKLIVIYNDYNIEKIKQFAKESAQSVNPTQKQPNVDTKNVDAKNVDAKNVEAKNNDLKYKCWRCNTQHPQGKCPAWGSKCTKCNDLHHFTQCCKGSKPKQTDKVNNLNPKEHVNVNLNQQEGASKSNKKKNKGANSETKKTDSMNKMTSFPDIPTVSSNAANSTLDDDVFMMDFVMLDAANKRLREQLFSHNTPSQSTNSPKNKQYNNDSYVKGAGLMKTRHEGFPRTSNNSQNHKNSSISYRTPLKYDQKKLEDSCTLS